MIEVNQFQPYKGLPYQRIVRRYDHIPAIAAVMLAKTIRDKGMEALATQYPAYGWEKHKGDRTPMHKSAIPQKRLPHIIVRCLSFIKVYLDTRALRKLVKVGKTTRMSRSKSKSSTNEG